MAEYMLVNHGGSANHGCEALVRTVNTLLGGKNTVMSDSPEEDFHFALNDVMSIVPATSSYSRASVEFISAYAKLKLRKDYAYMDVLPYLKPIHSMPDQSVAISVGGDIYCYDDYRKYIMIHQEIAKKHKTVLLGCSLEKRLFDDPDFMRDIGSYDYIFARESLTYGYLQEAGISNISLTPDTAFVLPAVNLPLPGQFIEKNTVGINVSPLIVRRETVSGTVRENYRHLIRHILDNTDCAIALIPHVVWRDNDDRTILKEFYDEFKDSERIALIEDHNCMELKGYISRCRFFVGARTHATIAAYSTCVPTLTVGYSTKSKGIAKDLFGTDENYVVPVQSFRTSGDLTNSFKWIQTHELTIKEQLQTTIPQYIKKIDSIKKLKDYVD